MRRPGPYDPWPIGCSGRNDKWPPDRNWFASDRSSFQEDHATAGRRPFSHASSSLRNQFNISLRRYNDQQSCQDAFETCPPAGAIISPTEERYAAQARQRRLRVRARNAASPRRPEGQQATKDAPCPCERDATSCIVSQVLSIAELHTCPGPLAPDDPPEAIGTATIQG